MQDFVLGLLSGASLIFILIILAGLNNIRHFEEPIQVKQIIMDDNRETATVMSPQGTFKISLEDDLDVLQELEIEEHYKVRFEFQKEGDHYYPFIKSCENIQPRDYTTDKDVIIHNYFYDSSKLIINTP